MRAPTRLSLRHRIADHSRERVLAGEFAPGARLPSEPDLARSLGGPRSVYWRGPGETEDQ
jgi:DNA-binding FadR family transcriptional regulator